MIIISQTEFSNNMSMEDMNVTEDKQHLHGRNNYALPLTIFSLAVCVIGLVGNGTVFWFLCFKIKRNQFTVYILSLTVADFTFLFGLWVWMMYTLCYLNGLRNSIIQEKYIALCTGFLYNFGFNASVNLLMVIGLARCLAVLYPFWYKCQCPKNVSVWLCIVSWLVSLLVTVLENFICNDGQQYHAPGSESCTNVYFFTSALYVIVVFIMVLSSVILLLTIQKASKSCHPPKLYIVIVTSITIFLISVIPARILGLLLYFNVLQSQTLLIVFFFVTSLCSAFNCSANPYIYMFVGMWGKLKIEESSIKQLLEKVFKEPTES